MKNQIWQNVRNIFYNFLNYLSSDFKMFLMIVLKYYRHQGNKRQSEKQDCVYVRPCFHYRISACHKSKQGRRQPCPCISKLESKWHSRELMQLPALLLVCGFQPLMLHSEAFLLQHHLLVLAGRRIKYKINFKVFWMSASKCNFGGGGACAFWNRTLLHILARELRIFLPLPKIRGICHHPGFEL